MDWRTHGDPRAVVPATEYLESPIILEASREMALASPCAYGLGVCTAANRDPSVRIPVPLFYVSERIAYERNLPELKAGWYAIASPGKQFEVIVSPLRGCKSLEHTAADAELIVTNVEVDGTHVRSNTFNRRERAEQTEVGFIQKCTYGLGRSGSRVSETIRKFEFCKTQTTEEENDSGDSDDEYNGSNLSTIRLVLETAEKGPVTKKAKKPKSKRSTEYSDIGTNSAVPEKRAKKEGCTLQARRDGEKVVQHGGSVTCFSIMNSEPIDDGDIRIYVRERYWMESRNIVDRYGKAFRRKPPPKVPVVINLLEDGGNKSNDQEDGNNSPKEKVKEEIDLEEYGKRSNSEKTNVARKQAKVELIEIIDLC